MSDLKYSCVIIRVCTLASASIIYWCSVFFFLWGGGFNQEGRNCDRFKRNVIETRGRRRRRSTLEQGQFPPGYWLLLRHIALSLPGFVLLLLRALLSLAPISPALNQVVFHFKPGGVRGWIYYDRRINLNLHHIIKSIQQMKNAQFKTLLQHNSELNFFTYLQ